MTIHEWILPNPFDGGVWPDNPSASGGEAQNGMEQNVFNIGMKLRARWSVALRTTNDILDARAFQARMRGKSGLCRMPLFDGKRTQWTTAFGPTPSRPVPTDYDVYGTAMAFYDYNETEIRVHMEQGNNPRDGNWFSIGGSRAYLITDVSGAGGVFGKVLNFIPPLREPLSDGGRVDFAELHCLMNQVRADQGIQMLDGLATTVLDMEFVEGYEDSALVSGS